MRKLGREHIIVPESIQHVNFNKMITLNSTAAYLWESVQGKDFTAKDLCELLLAQYEVDEATAMADSEKIAEAWKEAGIAVD